MRDSLQASVSKTTALLLNDPVERIRFPLQVDFRSNPLPTILSERKMDDVWEPYLISPLSMYIDTITIT